MDLDGLGGGGGGRGEEVVDVFVVDLEVGAPEEVFARWGAFDVDEYVFHGAGYYTWLFFITRLGGRVSIIRIVASWVYARE